MILVLFWFWQYGSEQPLMLDIDTIYMRIYLAFTSYSATKPIAWLVWRRFWVRHTVRDVIFLVSPLSLICNSNALKYDMKLRRGHCWRLAMFMNENRRWDPKASKLAMQLYIVVWIYCSHYEIILQYNFENSNGRIISTAYYVIVEGTDLKSLVAVLTSLLRLSFLTSYHSWFLSHLYYPLLSLQSLLPLFLPCSFLLYCYPRLIELN